MASTMSLPRARATCALAYVVALAAAAGALAALPSQPPFDDPLWRGALADVVATVVVFGFSRGFDNSSFYDPYWSVAPIALAGYWWALPGAADAVPMRQILVLILVTAWGVRLTHNWLRHWRGLHHEDWRYVDFRRKTGRLYWLVSFAGIHLFPTVQVFAGLVPVYLVMLPGARPLGAIDIAATAITIAAIAIETIADVQLHRFIARNEDPERVLDEGLWAWSRHPNYFGEMTFWWGLALFGYAAAPHAWWGFVGAVLITLMFFFISVPLIDERMASRRPGYRDHMRRISRLVPWPPAR